MLSSEKLNQEIIIDNLVSQYRGIKYTLEYVLRKGFVRSCLELDEIVIHQVGKTWYGDKDFIVTVKNLRCSPPEFETGSPWFMINGNIPIHTTASGKLIWDFGCFDENLDTQYKTEYWDETQDARLLIDVNLVDSWHDPETIYQANNWLIDGRPESVTLVELIKEVIARRAFT